MLLTKTSRSTNSMKISLSHSWEIEVYDNVDGLDIDTTRKEIGANQVSAKTLNILIKITTVFSEVKVQTFLKSWNTLFRCSWFILAWI